MKQPNVQGLMLPSHVATLENDIYPMLGRYGSEGGILLTVACCRGAGCMCLAGHIFLSNKV